MKITIEKAQFIDSLLYEAKEKGHYEYTPKDSEDYKAYELLTDDLKAEGLIDLLAQSEGQGGIFFQLTDSGRSFINSGGCTDQFNKAIEERGRQQKRDLINDKTLRAAKREPIYKLATIILSIISLILTYLQIVK